VGKRKLSHKTAF